MKKVKRKSTEIILIIAFISFLFSSLVYFSGLLKNFEYSFYDLLSKHFNPSKKAESIFLIYIDQVSLEALSKQGITWPWPRQVYAPVIDFLSLADAVFVDILFTENSSYGVEDDSILAEAIKKAGNVYLPFVLSKGIRDFDEDYLRKNSIFTSLAIDNQFQSVIFPIDILKNNSRGLGNVTISPDDDGVYRRVPLFFKIKDYNVPNFVVEYFLKNNFLQIEKGFAFLDKKTIPLNQNNLLLRYSSHENPFKIFPFIDILNYATSQNEQSMIKKEFFKNKKVLIGLSAAGLFDLKPTPISNKTPGVFVHATVLENLLNRDFIFIIPKAVIVILLFMISILISLFFVKQNSMKINFLFLLAILLFFIFVEIILFKLSFYMDFLPIFTVLIFSSIISLIYSYATEGREKSFIKKTFAQYMDRRIVEYLLNNPELISAGGQKKTVTVFFADIAGFTSISEKLTAEETALMLHRVLNRLTEVVIKNYGVVDKYIGDCIMAFWGAPMKTEEDELHACKSAIECIESLEEINGIFSKEGLPQIRIRIGIHTGEAVVGNIGSDRLFNYTVIGDTVNIASRLESANKFFSTKIIISEDTNRKVSDRFITRQLGITTVKGKSKPIEIYELLSDKENANKDIIELAERFNRGYLFFKEKKWNEAREIFESIIKDFSDDAPSQFYLKKIEKLYKSEQLTENWFIVKIEEK